MKKLSLLAFAAALAPLTVSPNAEAMPGFYAGKNAEKRTLHESQVVVLKKGGRSVVTIMPDYEGPLDAFAMVIPVPPDVTLERVKTLKREFVDRVDQMTAPRFHEFWEKDPCEPGKAQQLWERSMKASSDTAFLGGGSMFGPPGSQKKVAKELFIEVDPSFKEGEYGTHLLEPGEDVVKFLKGKGYQPPEGTAEAVKPYGKMAWVVAEVDPRRIELTGGDRAILSPLRFWTEQPLNELAYRLGLLNADGKQELVVSVLHAESRFEAKNYDNVFPPTNLEMEFAVKERMGEFYTAMHDMMLEKNPRGVLNEYAWSTTGCGEPCPNERLLPHEIMSLGGDIAEETVPEEERNPEPPELTEEEEKAHEAKQKELATKPKDLREYNKTFEEERKEVARRKALIKRNEYVVSRVHHRYDKSTLNKDLALGKAGAVSGGVGIPKGENHELSYEVKPAKENTLQMRYLHYHPWKGMQKCEKPERWRWGKPPRTYRGLRKIWIAEDFSRKNRKQIEPGKVVKTAVPSLGLSGVTPSADAGPVDGGEGAGEKKKSSCGCRTVGAPAGAGAWAMLLLAAVGLTRRRR